jgi:aspartyl-tRNA synthetase
MVKRVMRESPEPPRIDKLDDWQRSHYSADIGPNMDGDTVIAMGWVRAIRGGGNLIFLQLADREGYSQITVKAKEVPPELLAKVQELGREYVIAVKGTVKANKEAPNGWEIRPREIQIINRSDAPLPLELVTKKTPAQLPTRLDARFLDLRKPEVAAIFNVADTLKISFLNHFDSLDFININTPIIVGAATEGGTELFPVKYFDREAYLNQSPQLYKQIILSAGFDKVSIVTPVFRAEPHDTYRHLNEMVQMDIEVAWVRDEEDVIKFYDSYLNYAFEQVKEKCAKQLKLLGVDFQTPGKIKRITYDEALKLLNKGGLKLSWGSDIPPEGEKLICECHNPVIITKWPTEVRAFYSMPEPSKPEICRSYDLLYNGLEISSGAQRIHIAEDLIRAMEKRKLDPKNFGFYLDAFRYGMPPHGGWSIGLERLTMALLKLQNIREASLFPRTKDRLSP